MPLALHYGELRSLSPWWLTKMGKGQGQKLLLQAPLHSIVHILECLDLVCLCVLVCVHVHACVHICDVAHVHMSVHACWHEEVRE